METQLGSKFVHTAFAAAIVTLLTGGAGAQQCALPPNCTVSSGNVGIGTTSPATKLHVLGPGGGGVVATFDQPTGINFVDLRALDSRGPVGTALRFFGAPAITDAPTAEIRGTTNGQLRFATINLGPISFNALDRVVIDNFGNVGVGTEPGRTLDVEGPIVAASGSSAFLVAADAGGAASLWTNASYDRRAPFGGWFRTLNMKDGKVGIGTTNPQAQLDVVGVVQTSTLQITGGADLSEHFDVKGAANESTPPPPIQAGLGSRSIRASLAG
jgi:hypothetical protein